MLRAVKYITSGSSSLMGDVSGMIEKSLNTTDLRHYYSVNILHGIV